MYAESEPSSVDIYEKLSFLNSDMQDVVLKVNERGKQWTFGAHRLILSCMCPHFRVLLQDKDIQEIALDNVTLNAACLLLRFIYCGELKPEQWQDVCDLIKVAYDYKMPELVVKCEKVLENVITLQNVCYISETAFNCSLPALQIKCLGIILDAGFLILKSQAFTTISNQCIENVISSCYLNVDSELVVFEALHRWARSECTRRQMKMSNANIQKLLEPFLEFIRTDDMSDVEKSSLPEFVLTKVKANNLSRKAFNTPKCLFNYTHSLEFETDYNHLEFVGHMLTYTRFSVTHPVYLLGIELKCVSFDSSVSTGTFLSFRHDLVKENFPATVLARSLENYIINTTKISERKTWVDLRILFEHPAYLMPSMVYSIHNSSDSNVQVPQTQEINSNLKMHFGYLNFISYASETWGITKLIFL